MPDAFLRRGAARVSAVKSCCLRGCIVAYLSPFDADIGQSQRRASAQLDASMAVSVARARHCDFDILQLGCLRNAPVERGEVLACTMQGQSAPESYGRIRAGIPETALTRVILPPGRLVVSSTIFFKPTAKESSPLSGTSGSRPVLMVSQPQCFKTRVLPGIMDLKVEFCPIHRASLTML